MLAMTRPVLNKRSLLETHALFLQYIIAVGISSTTANDQKYMAYCVKNNNGIPAIVIPSSAKAAIIPRQRLWQICHPPRKLRLPERPLNKPRNLSVCVLPLFLFDVFFIMTTVILFTHEIHHEPHRNGTNQKA